MTLITTWLNYPETGPDMLLTTMPSETQPDEVLSIQEMLENHVRGIPMNMNVHGEGAYYPEEFGYIPSPNEIDIIDQQYYAELYANKVRQLEELHSPKPPSDSEPSGEADKPQKSDGNNEPSGE